MPPTCTKRPAGCTPGAPTCACDGKVYPSECEANKAGSAAQPVESCTTPAGMFPCYETFCDAKTEYCSLSEFAFNVMSFGCVPLPACPGPVCDCLLTPDLQMTCNGGGTGCGVIQGGLTLICDQS